MIDRATIERIKDTADIVDVVSDFVSLKKVGINYRGLCPFHNDHTPSFYVSPTRRSCHCFVCGEGGDSVSFIMKHEQLTYPEALRWLANKYHIEIRETELTDEQKKEQSEREAMFIVNEWAANYFKDILQNNIDGRAIGLQYFRSRGIRDDIIEKFRLGFCLNDRHAMAETALKQGYKEEYLVKVGLCYNIENSNSKIPFDRFSGRAIFPWIGISGKVVAFGGRVLDSRTKGINQKYVNSPDSEIFHKDHELYGIFQAKKAIAKENLVYMVEGYTDVISMHQCGIENVVANSGTALSEHQIHILHRFTSNIVLLYDGDAAGIKAALRGTDMLLKEGMNVKVMLLPDGQDPDEFAKKNTAEEFRAYIKDHQMDFIAFKTKVLLDGVTDPHERSEAISSIIKSVSVIGDPIVRDAYIQDCSARLGFSEQTLTAKMNEEIRAYREEERKNELREQQRAKEYQEYPKHGLLDNAKNPTPSTSTSTPASTTTQTTPAPQQYIRKRETSADLLMKMIIQHGDEILYENITDDDGNIFSLTVAQFIHYNLEGDNLRFANPMYNDILQEAVEHTGEENFSCEHYFTSHHDYEISSLAIKLTSDALTLSKSLEVKLSIEQLRDKIEHLLYEFRREYITDKLTQIRNEIKTTTDPERQMELIVELQETEKILTAIAKKIGGSLKA
ncbi:MAG: DNA primase [Prevotella sp.]|nr:DNA primase [Prevotella sp.]